MLHGIKKETANTREKKKTVLLKFPSSDFFVSFAVRTKTFFAEKKKLFLSQTIALVVACVFIG